MKRIAVKGVRRSGTNFLVKVLKDNLDVKVHTGEGGAHRRIVTPTLELDVYFIIIKNPYSWCLSITNWVHVAWGSDWRKATWSNDWDKWERLYKNYNNFYRTHIEFHNKHPNSIFIIKYEDFLRDPSYTLKFINKECGMPFKTNKLVIPNKVPQSAVFSDDRKKFYLNGNGYFGLDKATIRKINRCVDWDLMAYYGYERK